MIKKLLISLALVATFASAALAQDIVTEKGKNSDAIYLKIRQIDLMNQLLPLVLTKDQIGRILPTLEKVRAKQRALLISEDEEMAKVQARVEEVHANAVNKGVYPPKEFSVDIAKLTRAMSIRRSVFLGESTDEIDATLNTVLNSGQKKALANSFASSFIDPSKKPEELTDQIRTRFFIQRVLLDPLARELLIGMEKTAS